MPNESVSISVILADNMSVPLTKIGNGFALFGRKAEEARKKLDPLSKVVGALGKVVVDHSSSIESFGSKMAVMGGLVKGALILISKAAIDFEEQMDAISTLLNNQTMKYMPQYADQIKTLSISLGTTTDALAGGLYTILKSSVDASKAMDVLEVSSKAAKAGLTSTSVAAEGITRVLEVYGWSADKAGEVSDKLFTAVKGGKVTFAELAVGIGRIATLASSVGLSFEELLAALTALTKSGLSTEESINALRSILDNFITPSEASKVAAAELGIELTATALKGEGLLSVFKKLAGASVEQVSAIAPNIRSLVGLQGILQNTTSYEKALQDQMNSAGATQEAFAKQAQGASFAVDQMKAALQIARIEIGSALAPSIINLSKRIIDWAKSLRDWISTHEELLNGIMNAISAFGKYAIIIGGVIAAGGELIGTFKTIAAVAGILTTAGEGLGLATNILAASTKGLSLAFGSVGIIAIGLIALYVQYKAGLDQVAETQKLTNATMSKTVGIMKESQTAWQEYANTVVDSNERMTMAAKKAAIEQSIVDQQRVLAQVQLDLNANAGYGLRNKANRDMLMQSRTAAEASLKMNQQMLTDLTNQWKTYVADKKKQEAAAAAPTAAEAPKVTTYVTEEMKKEYERVQNEIIEIGQSKREADLANLDKWFKEQQKAWRGHGEELAAIESYYALKQSDINKKGAEDIIKDLEKVKKEREDAIKTENELAKSGVISFGEAQSKNRASLDTLNAKIEESKQKLKELFVDSPKLADEFIAKIDEMTAHVQQQKDEFGQLFTGFEAGIRNAADGMTKWADIGVKAGEMVADEISTGVADSFVEAIRGTKDFGDAMKEMASSIMADLAKMIIKALILRAVLAMMGMNEGGEVPAAPVARAGGGPIPGPNVNRDTVPAMLTPGEFVHRKSAVDYYGPGIMGAINDRLIPRSNLRMSSGKLGSANNSGLFAGGGKVGSVNSSPSPAYIVAGEQTLDRLLSGGNSAMINWISANRSTLRSILS
jgi:TP901 family phage tail tape measure protein